MYRRRLRPKYTDEQLSKLYPVPHTHVKWEDHKVRVAMTIALGKFAKVPNINGNVVDLSCGDGAIAIELAHYFSAMPWLGDFAKDRAYQFAGPLEKTLDQLPVFADLFICSETIEHLDEPDNALRKIRGKAGQLLLSTPIGETGTDNPEHYWGWDCEAVGAMLEDTGWKPVMATNLLFNDKQFSYNYQIWLCK